MEKYNIAQNKWFILAHPPIVSFSTVSFSSFQSILIWNNTRIYMVYKQIDTYDFGLIYYDIVTNNWITLDNIYCIVKMIPFQSKILFFTSNKYEQILYDPISTMTITHSVCNYPFLDKDILLFKQISVINDGSNRILFTVIESSLTKSDPKHYITHENNNNILLPLLFPSYACLLPS